jgi:peptide/nickel transport system substrate-binding protein
MRSTPPGMRRPHDAAWTRQTLFRGLTLLALLGFSLIASARDTLTAGIQLEPPGLDPTISAAVPISEVTYGSIFEGLTRFDADGAARPCLASQWQLASDGLSVVFQLRHDVIFHDGTPFDASVAQFSLRRALAADSINPQKSRLQAVSAIDALDRYTLRITLARRSGGLLQDLAWPAFVMVAPASAANDATHPVGTGPFKFLSWRRGESVELTRNLDYWGGIAPLHNVIFKFISEPTAAYAALMAGDVEVFPNYPTPESVAQFKRDPRFVVQVGSSQGKTILALNNRRAPLNRLDVRRAISYALDRAAIIDGAMFGYGVPIGSHFAPQDPDAVNLTDVYPHDVAKARALMAAAGYATGFPLTLKLPPPSYARRSGEIVVAQLAMIGIRVQIENIEWAQWLDQVFGHHEFDMTIVQHAEPMDADIYARDDYYFGYANARYRQLQSDLEASVETGQRRQILMAMQRRIAQDAVNGFLFEYPKLSIWDARLSGIDLDNPFGILDLRRTAFDEPAGRAATARGASFAAGSWLGAAAAAAAVVALAMAAIRFGSWFVWRRVYMLALTLVAASAVVFLLVQVTPGDPARFMLGLQARPETVDLLRHQLGLDHSIGYRYVRWMAGLMHGDFGISFTYRVPVRDLLAERLQVSLPLALYAMTIAVLIAFPSGLAAAAQRGKLRDHLISGITQLGVAMPNFWLGILLVTAFAVELRWVSAGGFAGWQAGFWPALASLTLPALALALPQAAILARVLRGALIEALQEDYVRTARAKGASRMSALMHHALPNAMIATLTVMGLQLAFLLAGAVIIENVFFLPGLGRLVFQAIEQRDLMVVQSVVIVLVFAVVSVSFVIDVAYALIDPRLRNGR